MVWRMVEELRPRPGISLDEPFVSQLTVEGNVQSKPRVSSTEQDLEVLPLSKVSSEIGPGGFRKRSSLIVVNGVDDVGTGSEISVDILGCLFDVSLNIHGVSWSLGDSQSEVESDGSWDHSDTDDESPRLVDGLCVQDVLVGDLVFEGGQDNERDDSRGH